MATLPAIANVASAISSGNFASNLATTTGGASSIVTSLNGMVPALPNVPGMPSLAGLPSVPGMPTLDALKTIKPPEITGLSGLADAAKGISSSAFDAISSSFKPLEAGVPQNLTSINLKNKLEQVAADTKTAAAPTVNSLSNSLSAAGVDVATGKIPAVDAAVASGGAGAGLSTLSGVMSNVPGMSSIGSPSAIASGVSNLPGGQSAISSIVNSSSLSTSGVTTTLGGLTSITKNASSAALNQISSATSGSSSITNLLSGGALTGAGASLTGALTNPSSILSGAGSLPSISGLPSTSGLPSVDSLTKGLQAGKQPLSSLVSTGISPAAAAALTASMNSLSTSSPFPIKMPTVAEKTVDRSEVSSQVTNLLGDKKVPPPNFSGTGPSVATQTASEAVAKKRQNYLTVKAAYDKEYKIRETAVKAEVNAYQELKNTLPAGDPERTKAKELGLQHIKEFNDWADEQETMLEQLRVDIALSPQ